MDGENLSLGDIYCQCKLTDDISWKRTKTINKCQNPQWYQEIILPITNESNQVLIELKNENLIKDTSYGSFSLNIKDISTKTIFAKNKLKSGSISYLIQKGKNGIIPFSDYIEPIEKILAENIMLG